MELATSSPKSSPKRSRKEFKKTQFKASFVDLWNDPNVQNSKIWKHKNLSSLSFFACRMKVIPIEMLRRWKDTLEIMSFSSNYIEEFPVAEEENGFIMSKLRAIDLNNNEFKSFPLEFLNQCPNIKELNLSLNEIDLSNEKEGPISFKLESLFMSQCKFERVPTIIHQLKHLKKLDLHGNTITEIASNFFHSKRNLDELNLSKNMLVDWNFSWNENDFGRARLRKLDISFNRLSSISFLQNHPSDSDPMVTEILVDSLHSSQRLREEENNEKSDGSSVEEEVEMGKGPDSEKESNSSDPSWKMSVGKENLLDWKLPELESQRSSFGLPGGVSLLSLLYRSLRVINASANQLVSIDSFLPLLLNGTLEVLVVSMNRITQIPQEFCTDSIKSLTWLDVSHNRIKSEGLPAGVFQNMSQLKHLYIQGNDFNNQTPNELTSIKIDSFVIEDHPKSQPSEIVKGKLYLGSISSAQSYYVMKKIGITHIVSVIREHTPFYPDDFKYHVIAADDVSTFDISKFFDDAHSFMEDALEGEGIILVHCAAGISRSATIVISFLMRTQKMSFREAYDFVRKQRSIICPNNGFRYQLEKFEKQADIKQSKCIIS